MKRKPKPQAKKTDMILCVERCGYAHEPGKHGKSQAVKPECRSCLGTGKDVNVSYARQCDTCGGSGKAHDEDCKSHARGKTCDCGAADIRKPKPQAVKPYDTGNWFMGDVLLHQAGHYIATIDANDISLDGVRPADAFGATGDEAKNRAILIVRAVNAHAGMVAALSWALRRISDHIPPGEGSPEWIKMREANAALRAAGEEV